MQFLSRQMMEFSHHVSGIECTNLLRVFWGLAKFGFLAGTDPRVLTFACISYCGLENPSMLRLYSWGIESPAGGSRDGCDESFVALSVSYW